VHVGGFLVLIDELDRAADALSAPRLLPRGVATPCGNGLVRVTFGKNCACGLAVTCVKPTLP
jgi:hypothetical protein